MAGKEKPTDDFYNPGQALVGITAAALPGHELGTAGPSPEALVATVLAMDAHRTDEARAERNPGPATAARTVEP